MAECFCSDPPPQAAQALKAQLWPLGLAGGCLDGEGSWRPQGRDRGRACEGPRAKKARTFELPVLYAGTLHNLPWGLRGCLQLLLGETGLAGGPSSRFPGPQLLGCCLCVGHSLAKCPGWLHL